MLIELDIITLRSKRAAVRKKWPSRQNKNKHLSSEETHSRSFVWGNVSKCEKCVQVLVGRSVVM